MPRSRHVYMHTILFEGITRRTLQHRSSGFIGRCPQPSGEEGLEVEERRGEEWR
jgi:hypothetical protein